MSRTPVRSSRSVVLLQQAAAYTRRSLASVREDLLGAATPCADWTLGDLLAHLADSLLTFTEAADVGAVAAHAPHAPSAAVMSGAVVERTRSLASDLLASWSASDPGGGDRDQPVLIGGVSLDRDLVAGVGALEIAVHGWDVARATGLDHPVPDALARALLEVAHDVVGAADRPGRFASEREPDRDTPQSRLLAYLGR